MLTFTLAISCLTSSNFPWFMDLTFQIPMQYCLGFFVLFCFVLFCCVRFYLLHQIHPQQSVISLWPRCFILSRAISSCSLFFASSILDTFWSGGLIFQCHIFLSFYIVHEILMANILGWFAIPSSSGSHFVRTLHYDHLLKRLKYQTILPVSWETCMQVKKQQLEPCMK